MDENEDTAGPLGFLRCWAMHDECGFGYDANSARVAGNAFKVDGVLLGLGWLLSAAFSPPRGQA